MSEGKGRITVFHDGACPICSVEIAHYRRCAGARDTDWVDVSNPDAEPGPDLPREAALRRFHVRRADGALVSGAAGFVHVWTQLPGWRWAARLASVPGVTPGLELAYKAILPLRGALSRTLRRMGAGGRA